MIGPVREGRALVKGSQGVGSRQFRTSSWLDGRGCWCCTSASFWWVPSAAPSKLEWFCLHALLRVPSFVIFSFSCSQAADCWHDLDNTEYDCWPINSPNDYNMISCGGGFLLSSLNDGNFSCKLGTLFPLFVAQKEVCGAQPCARIHAQLECVCSGGACVCFHRSGNGLGAASTGESDERGGVQRLVHGDGLGFLLRLRSQEQDIPVQVSAAA